MDAEIRLVKYKFGGEKVILKKHRGGGFSRWLRALKYSEPMG